MFGVLAGSYISRDAKQGMHVWSARWQLSHDRQAGQCMYAWSCFCLRSVVSRLLVWVIPIMSIPADVDARVTNLLQSSASGDKLVKTVQEVMHILRESNLVTTMRLEPGSVGVHPKNRDGLGLNSTDVHTLLANLLEVGFVGERVHAVAIEPASRDELLWNQQLVDGCNGKLGYMRSESLKALSLCGSHTNFVLRVIADGAWHDGPDADHVTVQGRLDVGLVCKRDAALGEHVKKGLCWEVLSYTVGQRWPELLQMVQAAGNATLQKSESELQVVRKTLGLIVQQQKAGIQLDFSSIKKKALASRPACGNSFTQLYQFALKLLVLSIDRLQGLYSSHGRPSLYACLFYI